MFPVSCPGQHLPGENHTEPLHLRFKMNTMETWYGGERSEEHVFLTWLTPERREHFTSFVEMESDSEWI